MVEYVELKETETITLETNGGIVSKEVIDTPTINFNEMFSETTDTAVYVYESRIQVESVIEAEETDADGNIIIATDNIITRESEVEEDSNDNADDSETADEGSESADNFNIQNESTEVDLSKVADNRVYEGEIKVTTGDSWKYGRTPCEWVFIEPGIQLVSNYRPNSSINFAIKKRVSSGDKGCYVPIFTETNMNGDVFDARLYIFEDYSKSKPEDMQFSNTLDSLTYEGRSIKDILKSSMQLSEASNGILKRGLEYINIVYVTDLDKMLGKE